MIEDIKFQFLGGVEEVGKLGMVLEIGDMRLLLEYGMSPGKPPTYPLKAPAVDLVLLTHAHLDHSGMIPNLFIDMGQRILTTPLTGEIADVLYKDSLNIARSDGYALPYDKEEIREAKASIEPVAPNERKVIGNYYELITYDAGHIPGSLMFKIVGDRSLLFTGDINTIDTHIVRKVKPVKCDILFLEGTYAGRDHPKKREEIEKELIDKIDDVVRRGGIALLPAFAVARSQEVAMILYKTKFNVWFDGMGKKISKIFLKYPRYLRDHKELKKAMNRINHVQSDRGRNIALKKADAIITSSGMMDGGPVLNYMKKLKNDKKSAVILTGYQVPDSNARLLVEKRKLDFYGVLEDVECEVEYFDLSAHAGHSELIDFAEKCGPEKIIIMHSENREALAEPLREIAEVYLPKTGEIVTI